VNDQLAGQASCLAAALLWAISVSLFKGPIVKYGAPIINLAKCLVATLLQGLTVWALGLDDSLWTAPTSGVVLIAASGVVGLVLGDTALFAAVVRIGVHRTLLLQTLSPLFAAVIAYIWLDERPTMSQALGGLLILAGIALVVAPRGGANSSIRGGVSRLGLLLGTIAAFGQGSGIVLAKVGMGDVHVLTASFLRLGAAAAGLALIGLLAGRSKRLWRLALDAPMLGRTLPAIVLGTYLALFLMMAGISLAPAAIAAVLLSTPPVFSLFIEAFVDKQPIALNGLAGTLLAVAGVAVLGAG
jgi:drug/metabolite transporter (DMT)-like permease